MDDVLIYGADVNELRKTIGRVIQRLRYAGMKLNREKCIFKAIKLKFIRHIVSENGLEAHPDSIHAISKLKIPTNKLEL